MGKDKRTFKSGGVQLFTFSKKYGKSDFDVIYLRAAHNVLLNVFGVRRPSKRALQTQELLTNWIEDYSKRVSDEKQEGNS